MNEYDTVMLLVKIKNKKLLYSVLQVVFKIKQNVATFNGIACTVIVLLVRRPSFAIIAVMW